MFKRYKEKEVKTLIRKLREEYDDVVRMIRGAYEEIKEENRNLRARLAQLEKEREGVSEQCRTLLVRLNAKYPDEAEVKDFNAFCDALFEKLQMKYESDSGFNMDDVLMPKEPLDLEKLCRELGLMGDKS